jgi:hypothetical protein
MAPFQGNKKIPHWIGFSFLGDTNLVSIQKILQNIFVANLLLA